MYMYMYMDMYMYMYMYIHVHVSDRALLLCIKILKLVVDGVTWSDLAFLVVWWTTVEIFGG